MRMGRSAALTLTMLLACATAPAAEEVVSFRNGGTGSYPDADPPIEWSLTKNVKWRWDSGYFATSIASPIIVGNRIFTLAQPAGLVCLDKHTGKELWRRERHPLENTAADDKAAMIEQWIVDGHRLRVLATKLNKPRGKKPGMGTMRLRKLASAARKCKPAEDRVVKERRLAQFKTIFDDGETNRVAYEAEQARLAASHPQEPFPDSKVKKLHGYLCATTPASDGERVVAVFYPGLMVCYDLAGNLLWRKAILDPKGAIPPGAWNAHAEVPVFVDGKLLLSWGQQTQLLDAKTGEAIWTRSDTGRGCATSPVVGNAGGGWYFARPCGGVRRVADGELVLETPGLNGHCSMAVSPDDKMLHFVTCAVRLPEQAGGKPEILWRLPEEHLPASGKSSKRDAPQRVAGRGHKYSAHLVHRGVLYYHNTGRRGGLSKLDAETGEILYGPALRHDIGGYSHGAQYSDMIAAGDYLFQGKDDGTISVLKAGRDVDPELVRQNPLEDIIGSDPVFQGRRLYIRTRWAVFCIEQERDDG